MNQDRHPVRARAYDLLSHLYLGGVAARDEPLLQEIPDLAVHLELPLDEDLEAAEHQRLFDREVLPYASVFLEADGNLGGDVSAAMARRFGAAGLAAPRSEPPDHLGHELILLRSLDRPRPDASAGSGQGAPGSAGPAAGPDPVDGVPGFLDGHVLWWLPALVPAVRRQGSPFWAAVADLTLDLVVDHRRAVVGEGPPAVPPPWNLRGMPRNPLDDSTVDLREVATFLTLPVRSGLYLAEADARAVGRTKRLPGGFGSRVRVVETVFHSAVAYDGMAAVAAELRGIVASVRAALEAMVRGRGVPGGFVDPWLRRLELTDALLERMGRGQGPVS